MGRSIGLDSSLFIYLLENNPDFADQAERILSQVEQGMYRGIFANVGVIEVLTGAKKKHNLVLAAYYRYYLRTLPHLTTVNLNASIIELASDLRATYNIATPDAIHVATAIDQKADTFITNDAKLKKITEIEVKTLKDLN